MLFRIAPWPSGVTPMCAIDGGNRASSTRPIDLAITLLGASLGLLPLSLSANPASVGKERETGLPACHSLMTDNECRTYRIALARAGTLAARAAIKARYDQLQHEREQTCACNEKFKW
ncbi:MAG: hypothetical protein ACLPXB_19715 [Thiobacillaceae bacterium]